MEKEKTKRRSFAVRRAVVVALVGVLGLTGCASVNYSEIFGKYFGEGDGKLEKELVSDVKYHAENQDYRIEVLSVMADHQVKSILFSVEAKNAESLEEMKSGKMSPQVTVNGSGGSSTMPCWDGFFGEEEKNERKQYFVYEGHSDEASHAKILCGVMSDGTHPDGFMSAEELEAAGVLVLEFPVKAEDGKLLAVSPENVEFPEGAVLDEIRIYRLSLSLRAYDEAVDESGVDLPERNKRYPEVIAETKDGRKVCLLADAPDALSMKVDEVWGFGEKGSSFHDDGRKQEYAETIVFTRAFDVAQVTRIWVNGEELSLHP